MPAYLTGYPDAKSQAHYGVEAFVLGPIGLFAGHASWVANPILWVAWFKRTGSQYGLPFVLALLAGAVAASFLLNKTIAVGSAGEYSYKATYGFYVWLASMCLAAAASWFYPAPAEEAHSSQNAL